MGPSRSRSNRSSRVDNGGRWATLATGRRRPRARVPWLRTTRACPSSTCTRATPCPSPRSTSRRGRTRRRWLPMWRGTGRLPSAGHHACLPPVCRRSCLRMCPCPRRGRPARLSRRGRCPVAVVHPRLHPRRLGARQHRSVAPSARDIYGLARRRRHLTPCRPVGLLGPGQPAGGSPPGAVRLLWCRGAALASAQGLGLRPAVPRPAPLRSLTSLATSRRLRRRNSRPRRGQRGRPSLAKCRPSCLDCSSPRTTRRTRIWSSRTIWTDTQYRCAGDVLGLGSWGLGGTGEARGGARGVGGPRVPSKGAKTCCWPPSAQVGWLTQ